ncbi:CDP-diacylglycerol--serine O-phosphatidyltransferase [Sphingomonas xinjiangensis]|uniref:CDP-diacylglycerol--serine O-phosphatidyltransferase n=1 Tax=Sphingomonas xinjiangensis TaxID=643568 RepID=A0A840YJQ7_9SPHN|nr:CDP-diacylglycerol--serine O-phosphatidyltransferase [Sphingomonas xinjiangensis]MBB5709176.1 CDP-diacylglycerol--serine O-phosphatidyltransferase [Sphingomonas xinjiangensis]
MREPRLGRSPRGMRFANSARGIPLRAVLPNTVTALALCSGLTAIRFAMIGKWELAVLMVLAAAVLDGVDGKIARLVRAESRFGAELDSLSDAISFGVAPALILYLWSLNALGRFGWLVALLLALFCALRLARFNANIDQKHQPHKSAGFLTGVPAPAGALLALTPLYLWLWTGEPRLNAPAIVAPWTVMVAILMISSVATFAPTIRLKQNVRFEAVAVLVVFVAALVSAPWPTLAVMALAYLAAIPFSIRSYRRIRRLRAVVGTGGSASVPASPAP